MEREGISTLSIRGFPRVLRYLLIFLKNVCVCVFLKIFVCFMITLVSVLKSVDKAFLKIVLKA